MYTIYLCQETLTLVVGGGPAFGHQPKRDAPRLATSENVWWRHAPRLATAKACKTCNGNLLNSSPYARHAPRMTTAKTCNGNLLNSSPYALRDLHT